MTLFHGAWCFIAFAIAGIGAQDAVHSPDGPGDRLRDALERSPRPGTALDRWFRHLLDHEAVDETIASQRERAAATDEVADDLVLALLLERSGDTVEAGEVLLRASRDSTDAHAARLLGDWLVSQRRWADAVDAYEVALARSPTAVDRMDLRLWVGRLYVRLGRQDDAKAAWSILLAEHPEDRLLREELADVLSDEGLLEEARATWADARRLAGDDLSAQFACSVAIAHLHQRESNVQSVRDELIPWLDRLDAEHWQARDVRERIVKSFLDLDDEQGLTQFFERRLATRPDDVATRLAQVDALRRMGRSAEARESLREAVRLAPTRMDLRARWIDTLLADRAWDDAEAACRTWIQLRPDDPESRRQWGAIRWKRAGWSVTAEQIEGVLDAWTPIAELAPADATRALDVAALCETLAERLTKRLGSKALDGRGPTQRLLEAAENAYRLAAQRDPGLAEVREAFGEYLAQCGRHEEARAQWNAMVAPPMDTAERFERLGDALARAGAIDDAVEAYERSLERTRNPATRLLRRCVDMRVQDDEWLYDDALAEALDRWEEHVQGDVALERVLHRRVTLSAESHLLSVHIDTLRRRLRTSHSARDAWLLGLMQVAHGEPHEALESFRKARSLAPERPLITLALADALAEQGWHTAASQNYRTVAKQHSSLAPRCLEQVVHLELARGDLSAARKAADDLLLLTPNHLDTVLLAVDVAKRTGDDARALTILRHAVRIAPRDVPLRQSLAAELTAQGRPQDAAEHLWQAFLDAPDIEVSRALATDLGRAAIELHQVDAFEHRLRRLSRDTAKARIVHLALADYFVAAERADLALDHLEQRLQSEPDQVALLQLLLDQAIHFERFRRAGHYAQRMADLEPTAEHWCEVIRWYARADMQSQVETAYLRLLAADPSRDDTLVIDALDLLGEAAERLLPGIVDACLSAHPDSLPLRAAAALLALGRGDLDAMEEHFGALLALAPNEPPDHVVFYRTELGAASERYPPLAVDVPLPSPFRPSWFEHALTPLMKAMPPTFLDMLTPQWGGLAYFSLQPDGRQRRLHWLSTWGSNISQPASRMGVDVAVPDFTVHLDAAVLLDLRGNPYPEESAEGNVLRGLRANGQPMPLSLGPVVTRSVSDTPGGFTPPTPRWAKGASVDGWVPGDDPPRIRPAPWPWEPSFGPLLHAWCIAHHFHALLNRAQWSWMSFESGVKAYLEPHRFEGDEAIATSLHVLLNVATQQGNVDDWIARMSQHPAEPVRAHLAPVLAMHGHSNAARHLLQTTSGHAATLGALDCHALSLAADRGFADEHVAERAVDAVRSLASQPHHAKRQLALVSHLAAANEVDAASEVFARDVLPHATPEELLEYVPWFSDAWPETALDAAWARLRSAARSSDDHALSDAVLLAEIRHGPEAEWPNVAQRLIARLRRGAQRADPCDSTRAVIRWAHHQSSSVSHLTPRPALGVDGDALTLIALFVQRSERNGWSPSLETPLTTALEQVSDRERPTLARAAAAVQWFSGRRPQALRTLAKLRREFPDNAPLALAEAHAQSVCGTPRQRELAVEDALRVLESEEADRPAIAHQMYEARSIHLVHLADQLLGSRDDVLGSLLGLLADGESLPDLARYLPRPAEAAASRRQRELWNEHRDMVDSWVDTPTTWLPPAELIAHAKETGLLEALSDALEAIPDDGPTADSVHLLRFLVAEHRGGEDVTSFLLEVGRADVALQPLHPCYESSLVEASRHEATREIAARGLLRIALDGVAGGDGRTALRSLSKLFQPLLSSNESTRAAWTNVLCLAFGTPTANPEHGPALADAVIDFLNQARPQILPQLVGPAFLASAPSLQRVTSHAALTSFYPALIHQHAEAMSAADHAWVAEAIERVLLQGDHEAAAWFAVQSGRTERVRSLLLIGAMVTSAARAGTLAPFRNRLRAHSLAETVKGRACRLAAALAAGDAGVAESLQLGLARDGWSRIDFGPDLPGDRGTFLASLADTLERRLTAPGANVAEVALQLCEVQCLLEATDRARLFARMAHRSDADRALDAGWRLLLPAVGSPHASLIDVLSEIVPDEADADQQALNALRFLLSGRPRDAMHVLHVAHEGPPRTRARATLLHAWCSREVGRRSGADEATLGDVQSAFGTLQKNDVDVRLELLVMRMLERTP